MTIFKFIQKDNIIRGPSFCQVSMMADVLNVTPMFTFSSHTCIGATPIFSKIGIIITLINVFSLHIISIIINIMEEDVWIRKYFKEDSSEFWVWLIIIGIKNIIFISRASHILIQLLDDIINIVDNIIKDIIILFLGVI